MYCEYLPESIWGRYAAEYRKLDHVMLYALHNSEMLEFVGDAADMEQVSLLCRPFHVGAAKDIRKAHKRKTAYVSPGMSAAFRNPINVANLPYDFITNDGIPLEGDNVMKLDWTIKNAQDYILTSDYVISKAGWSTVAEAILARKTMALFERDTVLEDRATIRILENQGIAVKVKEEDLLDIPSIIRRLEKISLDGFAAYHDASEEVAKKILSLKE